MKIEDIIKECEFNLNQIKHFDPEPFYVNHFFSLFLKSINQMYDAIFAEANNDFGLFVSGEVNKEKFLEKAQEKKDQKAIDFVKWFDDKISTEHKNAYPKFMKDTIEFQKKFKKLPKIKMMIRAKDRYSEDPNQEISVSMTNGKLMSKEELKIETKRNLPVFLEMINNKRTSKKEPRVNEKQVVVSSFLQIDQNECETVYLSETYIPVVRRIYADALRKIQEMTRWE